MGSSVAVPDVFEPPGSGSVSTRYGSVSGSFQPQAKIMRKTLIPTVWSLLYDFLNMKNDVNIASKSNMQKVLGKKLFLVAIRIRPKITDPQHW